MFQYVTSHCFILNELKLLLHWNTAMEIRLDIPEQWLIISRFPQG